MTILLLVIGIALAGGILGLVWAMARISTDEPESFSDFARRCPRPISDEMTYWHVSPKVRS